jgi:hypothetical protein
MTSPSEAPPRGDLPVARDTTTNLPLRVLAMTVGISFFLSVVAFTGLTLVALLARRQASEDRHLTGTIRSVSVQGDDLAITVVGTAAPGTATVHSTLSWSWGRPHLIATLTPDGTLTVRFACSNWQPIGCDGHLQLQVPPSVSVTGSSSGGDVTAEHVQGALDLESSGGGLRVEDARGSLVLNSSGGGISTKALRSSQVRASSSGGGVNLAFASAPDDVQADSSGGGVRVLLPPLSGPYHVDAKSSGGDTHTRVRTDPQSPRRIYVRSSGGGVTVDYQDG